MAIDFPASPTNGQTFTSGSVTYTWDGTKWTAVAAGGSSNSISQGNTNATVTDTGSDGRFVVTTEGSERLRVTSAGLVGIGTSVPDCNLHVDSSTDGVIARIKNTAGLGARLAFESASIVNTSIGTPTGGGAALAFYVAGAATERARIDSSGRLLVGTSTSNSNTNSKFQIADTSSNVTTTSYSANNSSAGYYYFFKNRGASVDSHTVLQSGDGIANLWFGGSDGTTYRGAASIEAVADGGWSSGDAPGRLVFSTTEDGSSSPTERLRITNGGNVYIGQSTSATPGLGNTNLGVSFENTNGGSSRALWISRAAGTVIGANRNTDDGTLISLRQDGTEEGNISVSGTTVSYNGAHLSRWSQLPSGAERTEILRGTVLSNIDEMCEWGDEDNEQLNRMKVSDVEGDKNVSGVFQAWDDDDDTYTNDFYCAMTGDFIIRIGAGVTVERGDLLMSAGDGTAKPQDDDIIRSKTIAKVTSTTVSCTYDDGSYCVPCVLMAC